MRAFVIPSIVLLLAASAVAVGGPLPKPVKWVTVRGQVTWPAKEELPKPKTLGVTLQTTDGDVALRAGPLMDESLSVDGKTRGVRNVFVWLRPDSTEKWPAFPAERIHPDLRKPTAQVHTVCRRNTVFTPRIVAVRAGDQITFKNGDPVATNICWTSPSLDFNRTFKADDQWTTDPLKADGPQVLVRSHVHYWSDGIVRVFDHPYYALTDQEGRFELPQVSTGKWRIVYYHEKGYHKGRDGFLGFPLEVPGDKGATLTVPPIEYDMPKAK